MSPQGEDRHPRRAVPSAQDGSRVSTWFAVGSDFGEDGGTLGFKALAILPAFGAVMALFFLVVNAITALTGDDVPAGTFLTEAVWLVSCLAASALLVFLGWLRDRRLVIEIRLIPADRPTEVVIRRVSGSTVTHPIREFLEARVVWSHDTDSHHPEPGRDYSGIGAMTMTFKRACYRCREAHIPVEWRQTLTALGVHVKTEIHRVSADRDVGP